MNADANAELVPSPAATVVLLRDERAAAGLEVLLVRRNSQLAFYGGAWVFPGGRIDAGDGEAGGDLTRAARRAAIRELAEEAGLAIDAAELVHFAQWLTPPGRPRRFDTWYFAARAPAAAVVRVDRAEVDAYRWMQPAAALAASAAGEIELPPPTFVTLTELARHAGADAAYRALGCAPLQRFEPRPCPAGDGVVYLYAGDAGYAARDPEIPGPRHRLVAVGGVFRYERTALKLAD